jgi:hypothetical protein
MVDTASAACGSPRVIAPIRASYGGADRGHVSIENDSAGARAPRPITGSADRVRDAAAAAARRSAEPGWGDAESSFAEDPGGEPTPMIACRSPWSARTDPERRTDEVTEAGAAAAPKLGSDAARPGNGAPSDVVLTQSEHGVKNRKMVRQH